ncbi:response regulator [Bacillus sonorensis]|uniref:Two-component response regulator GlnL n=2 Tax=Bacillus sonorensis TaxID=119858 RepID=M5NXV5_9BACI|nr:MULTISPECIES: response regulator [Bacillus]TWK73942.1 Stage 0 sporulation protein A [Bacillus paralicheniformis]ASB91241.1 Transcriptional regulatory protein GlnL [Bacillus sonorensis]EME72716.1 two-component response regulator GlnL [Bacillus sonorensis L12]MBG9917405.1 transcriptional regulator [Bacillus sonorensis]MCF7620025.1 response regulator [Bacillus sonorensis]
MRFFIVDDDRAVRSILKQIIEDEDLGEAAGEAEDGSQLEGHVLHLKQIDVLLIDLLMPGRDGIETIRHLQGSFMGKIIMISQVESKEMVAEAHSLGIEYYIHKPINRIEILNVIQKVKERIELERSIQDIQSSLSRLVNVNGSGRNVLRDKNIQETGEFLLSELGIVGESGSKDLIAILQYLFDDEQTSLYEKNFPPLKQIFIRVAEQKLGQAASPIDINREAKASEQRIRRAVTHSLNHFASLGLTDFSNPKFESYASRFFDFTVISKKMKELQKDSSAGLTSTRVNTKKFIQVFFLEAKRLNESAGKKI